MVGHAQHAELMYERFTDSAQQVVVLAQDEARDLDHNYIGTEHLLLGLLAVSNGIAARALIGAGITLDGTRALLLREVGRGKKTPSGHIPLTPNAKKTLELALREALQQGLNYVGTEALLLGLIRDTAGTLVTPILESLNGDKGRRTNIKVGMGLTLLTGQGVDLAALRQAVLDLLAASNGGKGPRRFQWAASQARTSVPSRTTTAADDSLDTARRLAGADAVGSHHLLLAALSDPANAATKALRSLGVDVDTARRALHDVDVTGTTDELPEQTGRRRMNLYLSGDVLVLEATDAVLIEQARKTLAAAGQSAGEAGRIRGDLDICVSLGDVWTALNLSLKDIQRRATNTPTTAEVPAGPRPAEN